MGGALILMRMAHLQPKTALLATLPGGVIEMANVATGRRRSAADPGVADHAGRADGLRMPFVVTWLAEPGARNVVTHGEPCRGWRCGADGGVVRRRARAHRFKIPNSWFLGSLFVMSALGAHEPHPRAGARLDPGGGAGHHRRLDRDAIQARVLDPPAAPAPRVAGDRSLCTGDDGADGRGFLLHDRPAGNDLVLALAPAGIAEMALTGKVLGLDAALITGFQIVRIVLVLSVAARASRLFERLVARWSYSTARERRRGNAIQTCNVLYVEPDGNDFADFAKAGLTRRAKAC